MIGRGELRKGITIELDGELYQVLDYQHIKIGRGSAQLRMKLREIRGGHTVERTFQADAKFPRARVDRRLAQYLYSDGDLHYFMDTESFEQFALNPALLGEALNYLKEEMSLAVLTYKDEPIGVELPVSVPLQVTGAAPGFKGDTATSGSKSARLETGITVQVPLFINVGDTIKVDTRTGEYLERLS